MTMRLVILSDTHGLHESIRHMPDGDVLIHCGDCTNDIGQASLRSFLGWFAAFPHKHKIFIAGNHDGAFEKWPLEAGEMVGKYDGVTYLQESSVIVRGMVFYGMPQTPEFCNWYFNVPRGLMVSHTNKIPDGTNVLITHGPPAGILDLSAFGNERVGCAALANDILRVKPTVHCFGHIHHSYGTAKSGDTTFINAAICDEKYRPVRHPVVFDI